MASISEEAKNGYFDPKMYKELKVNNDFIDENTIIVLDTNIILNMYFIEDTTYLKKYLVYLLDYMWIPNRVYEEYNNNREGKINEIISRIDGLKNYKNEIRKYMDNQLKQYEFLPTHHGNSVRRQVIKRLEGTINYIAYIEKDLKKIRHNISGYRYAPKDKYLEILEETIFKKIGRIYSVNEIEQIKAEAIEQYKKEILPGYSDFQNEKIGWEGDYVIWKQIIEESRKQAKHVLWVTEDVKEAKTDPSYIENLKVLFRKATTKNIEIINFNKLIQNSTKSSGNFEELVSKMREENKDWKRPKNFFDTEYTYIESLQFITLQRREEYVLEERTNSLAFYELSKVRSILERKFHEILCSQIYVDYCAFTMDVLIKKDGMLLPVCKITYKADTCLLIFMDVKEGHQSIAKDDENQLPRTGYEVEILKAITRYISKYMKLKEGYQERFEKFHENVEKYIKDGYYD